MRKRTSSWRLPHPWPVVGLLLLSLIWCAGCQQTPTVEPSPTPTPTRAATSTPEPAPTATPTSEPTATPPPTATATATSTATPSPTPTATPTPTASPTATATETPSPTPTPTPTPSPAPTATRAAPTPLPPTAVPTATAAPTASVLSDGAWQAEYYGNPDLAGVPLLVREDRAVDFDWGEEAPAPSVPADRFSVRWTQSALFEEGMYDFHATMDDGMRVYVDDELLIDEWQDGVSRELVASKHMSAGTHALRVEYYDRGHDALAHLWWEKLRTYAGWRALYWDNRDLRGNPLLVRDDAPAGGGGIDFNWGRGRPVEGVPEDNFSVRWVRDVTLEPGTYRFTVSVDDGARLWVDERKVLDAWYDSELHTLTADYVVAGTWEHEIRLEYYDHTLDARIALSWTKIGSPSYAHWKGEYWPNMTLSGDPALVRDDENVNFNWGRNAPAPNLPVDEFSARWSHKKKFNAGTYRFYAEADDGVRLWVDGRQIIDEWHSARERTYQADMALNGGDHDLLVEFYERSGDARIKIWWERL